MQTGVFTGQGTSMSDLNKKLIQSESPSGGRTSSDENDRTIDPAGSENRKFHICALGASAGGLAALREFFKSVSVDLGVVYVVIQHLSPKHESRMPELLSRVTTMPVEMVSDSKDGCEIRPDHIYLIPPARTMVLQNGRLLLSERVTDEPLSLPIDHFFLSLAGESGRFGIAIVLSGTGSDGSDGIDDVHRTGGLVMAQSPDSAAFAGMPTSAIETGKCDVVLPPTGLAEALDQYVRQSLSREAIRNLELADNPHPGTSKVLELLRADYQIDFSIYKSEQVIRRIERRQELLNLETMEEYHELIQHDAKEKSEMLSDLLIGVTSFFRDKEAFDILQHEALSKLIANKKDGEDIRIWIAGCASGEEAYSIAILVEESIRRAKRDLKVKFFASDVHRAAIDAAAAGTFSKDAMRSMPDDLREKYFVRTRDHYQVIASLRQKLVFVRHNLMTDAPFTRMDLITCRNLLIYLQENAKNKVLALFHFSLNAGGFLFLGSSEALGPLEDEFESISKTWRLFRKLRDVQLAKIKTQRSSFVDVDLLRRPANFSRPVNSLNESRLQQAYDLILGRTLPAGFLVDYQMRLLHTFGNGGDFLVPQSGRHSDQLSAMIHSDLRAPLNGAVQHCIRNKESVRYAGVLATLDGGGEPRNFTLSVDLFQQDNGIDRFLLITFEETKSETELSPSSLIGSSMLAPIDVSNDTRNVGVSLEDELRFTRENLQATIQELESSNEELQATNEEIVASNEELQSTNEELQSVNEELHTVNAEYHRKIGQLRDLNDDMDNLLRSSDVAVLFLDAELSIRRFTPRLGELFSLRSQDIGRPIDNFRSVFVPQSLLQTIRNVLRTRVPSNEELEVADGRTYLIRVTPFDSASTSDGVVINYTDTTLIREREESAKRWASIVESTADCIVAFDLSRTITQWNRSATETYGFTAEDAVGAYFFDLVIPSDSIDENAIKIERVRSEELATEFQTKRKTKDGKFVDVSVRLSPVIGISGIAGISSIERDISQELRKSRLRSFELNVQSRGFSNQPMPKCWDDLQRAGVDQIGLRCFWLWQINPRTDALSLTFSGFGTYEDEWKRENDLDLDQLAEKVIMTGTPVLVNMTHASGWQQLDSSGDNGDVKLPESEAEKNGLLLLFPLMGHGQPIGVSGFLIDAVDEASSDETESALSAVSDSLGKQISEQARYEELVRMSGIVENANDFIATADGEGNLVSLNRAAKLITGVGLEDDPRDLALTDFFTAESVKKIVSEGIPGATRMGTWTGETQLRDSNGNEIPVSQLITAHRDAQGKLEYISTICRIIAEQKNVQHRLGQLIHDTASANEAKTTFLANISHDVRTPMTTVIGMADLLLDQQISDEQKEMLETIRSSGKHVTELLNDLLDLSKVESGQLTIEQKPVSIKQIIEETLSAYRPILANHHLELRVDIARLPDRKFMADGVRTRQVFDNLLSNAIKFTTDGFVSVRVELDGDEFVIEISDTGCGIEKSLLSVVFDPYTQSTPTSSRRVRGAGLGLAISRKLTMTMGGSLDVESVAGEGSCFTLRLPAIEFVESAKSGKTEVPEFPAEGCPLEGKRVLVAEDTKSIQFLVKRILEREGVKVSVVGDGKAAVDKICNTGNRQGFDALLLDMQMPIMDGYHAARQLRESGETIPIVAMTASTMPEEQAASEEAGCNAFVPKPIDRERLLTTLLQEIAKA